MQIIQNYTTQNDGYKRNGSLKPQGIMIHSTATPGVMAPEFRERFNKPGLGKSVHAFVDDAVCVQCLPWDKKAGHCLLSGNNTHIGIEMCEPKDWQTNKEYFDKVFNNAVELAADLCRKYGLTADTILSHAEGYQKGIASNHADVGHWFPYFNVSMNDFRAAVTAQLAAGEKKMSNEEVRSLQSAINTAYKAGLAEDNSLGPLTKSAIKKHPLSVQEKHITNAYVKWVQQRLIAAGFDCGKWGADGEYGEATKAAVQAFQKANGLAVDGVVGLQTILVLLK